MEKKTQKIIVDLSSNTGSVKKGAIGFLYGLGDDQVPNINCLTPIKPYAVAQKPPRGLQHPNGDSFNVADTFKKADGKQIQVYMQDIYAKWPYETQDISDYLEKVETIVKAVIGHEYRDLFAYVPFNEPDWIWYNVDDKKEIFFQDWDKIYKKIRSIDPVGKIIGPNAMIYNEKFYEDFIKFCLNNDCMPDVISWHELDPKFFAQWHLHLNHYRSIEKKLGIKEKAITINEYANWRDLGVPGQLIQWIAKLEESKVEGCLAYWHAAGNLNDLIVQNNQVTAGWWLFKWYADLTGNTVNVIPPEPYAEGLHGLAAIDPEKRQVRVIFGGSDGSNDIKIKGCSEVSFFKEEINVKVWCVDWSGYEGASDEPFLIFDKKCTISNDNIVVNIEKMISSSAYLMIISDCKEEYSSITSKIWKESYEADMAEITDCIIEEGGNPKEPNKNFHSNNKWVKEINKDTSRIKFVIDVPINGSYLLSIFYGNGHDGMAQQLMKIDDEEWNLVEYHPNLGWGFTDKKNINLELLAGTHTITFAKFDSSRGRANLSVDIDKIELTFMAEAISIKRYYSIYADIYGNLKVDNEGKEYSGAGYVKCIGVGKSGINFTVNVNKSGFYKVKLNYSSFQENKNIKNQSVKLYVNDLPVDCLSFPNTSSWDDWENTSCSLFLPAGISLVSLKVNGKNKDDLIRVNYLDIEQSDSNIYIYDAQSYSNTLGGTVELIDDQYASGGKYAGGIGNGSENYLQFNNIKASKDGAYKMVVYYANAEKVGEHQYNINIVDRYADIEINSKFEKRVYFRNTYGWNSYRSKVIDINLKSGDNFIRFYNNEANAPNIDKIMIAPFII